MPMELSAGMLTLIVVAAIIVFGIIAFLSLRGHVRKAQRFDEPVVNPTRE